MSNSPLKDDLAMEEELLDQQYENEHREETVPPPHQRKPKKSSRRFWCCSSLCLTCCKWLSILGLILVLVAISFAIGFIISWFTKTNPQTNQLKEGTWANSNLDDTDTKKFEPVWEIANAEKQVISNVPRDVETEARDAEFVRPEDIGHRTVLYDPKTKKPLFHMDVEYVRDLALGQIVDEEGETLPESLRVTIRDLNTGDKAEVIPMAVNQKEDEDDNFERQDADVVDDLGRYYFEWNDNVKAILHANASDGEFELVWPKYDKDVDVANAFLDRFMQLYDPIAEAESNMKIEDEELYDEDESADESKSRMIKRFSTKVRGTEFFGWYNPKNCWVSCGVSKYRVFRVVKTRSRCGKWISFGRWIVSRVVKRCFRCSRCKRKCNGFDPSDPRACSGHGKCVRGKCKCNNGWAGKKCDHCACRFQGKDCNQCKSQFSGPQCKECADGYWPAYLCTIKRSCHGIPFDNPNVCSGHGSCSSGLGIFGKCTCNRGFTGSKCDTCLPNFKKPKCNTCIDGFSGSLCQTKRKCGGIEFDAPNVCNGRGTCSSGNGNNGVCTCQSGYQGQFCEKFVPVCFGKPANDPSVCGGKGTCTANNVCECVNGYSGSKCEVKRKCGGVDFDSSQVCSGRGSCSSGNGNAGVCTCQQRFTGPTCAECTNNRWDYSQACLKCTSLFDGASYPACDSCANKKHSSSSGCTSCTPPFSGYPSCASCQNSRKDPANGCQTCLPQFKGASCEQCTNSKADPAQDCSTCLSTYTNFPACDVCSQSPRLNATTSCQFCNKPFTNPTNGCQDCLDPLKDKTKDCAVCRAPYAGESCEQCLNPRKDRANNCQTCLPAFKGSECDLCANDRHDKTKDCGQCVSTFKNFPACDQCSNQFQVAPDCKTCVAGRTNFPLCDQCASGFFDNDGTCQPCNCDAEGSVDNTCDATGACTCKPNHTGKKCSACEEDAYDKDGVCVKCNCNLDGTVGRDGSCTQTGQCECLNGFFGLQCQVRLTCNGVDFEDPQVCGGAGKGVCVGTSPEGTCQCTDSYSGPNCEVPICFGRPADDSQVCGGHGTCSGPDTCDCENNWLGSQCEQPLTCGSKPFNDPNVCSNRGTCTSNGCQCQVGYSGSDCQDIMCFGVASSSSDVCSGRGQCIAPDTCRCDEGFSLSRCEGVRKCNDVPFNDPQVCSGHGSCSSGNDVSGSCTCAAGFAGADCNSCDNTRHEYPSCDTKCLSKFDQSSMLTMF